MSNHPVSLTTPLAMNFDESEASPEPDTPHKKLSRKEKKARKRAEKTAKQPKKQTTIPPAAASEMQVELEPAQVQDVPAPRYSTWEKISPPARRKKQLATMESGYREVLALVQSMRENQEVLMESFRKLPEAVDSVKKLADHSAQQSDILHAMNEQL